MITRRPTRRGLTLVESMIATVVLTISAAAVADSLSAAYQQHAAAARQAQALVAATELLEAVACKPTDPNANNALHQADDPAGIIDRRIGDNPEPQVIRSARHIDECHGRSDVWQPPLAETRTAAGEYARRISVTRSQFPGGPIDPSGMLITVVVTVDDPTGKSISLERMISAAQ
jgi:prepilin-type N-terminal cleavage/methylation domain-containing protein